jgi:transcriptional antiterminator Rof (Rho-off)
MSHETYQPIACPQYDLYEIAIMRGQFLDLMWCDEQGVEQQARVQPVGLETREGQAFLLLLRDPGKKDVIASVRLDRIRFMK